MAGCRATARDQPDYALEQLEREGQESIELLREIVTRVCLEIGPRLVGDPNRTRALAISANSPGQRTPQFFAIITDRHKGCHPKKCIGPRGFSIQVAFRKDARANLTGTNWVCNDRFDYEKQNQVWCRNELEQEVVDVDSIVAVVARAKKSFFAG